MRLGPCRTDIASMQDKAVAEVIALLRRDQLPHLFFHFRRLFYVIHDTDTVTQTDTVCICHHRRLTEDIAQNQVGALASHSRKLQHGASSCRL